MQTPLRALVHFLTVGWKKHMPGVKKRTNRSSCVFQFLQEAAVWMCKFKIIQHVWSICVILVKLL